jgi:hypothetical protein
MSRKYLFALMVVLVLVLAVGCGSSDTGNNNGGGNGGGDPQPAVAQFVGSDNCKMCHNAEYGEWENSWHTIKATKGPAFGAEFESNIFEWVRNDWDNLTMHLIVDEAGKDEIYVSVDKFAMEDVSYVIGQIRKQRYAVYYDGGAMEVYKAYTEDGGISYKLNTEETSQFEGNKERAGYNFLFIEARPNGTENANKYGEHRSWQERCIACHTTGFDRDAWDEAKTEFVAGQRDDLRDIFVADLRVGCEACHGPGSLHLETRAKADIVNPSAFDNYEDRMTTCEQCHDRNTRSTHLGTANDARGFVVGSNLDDFRVQISPAWGKGSRNVSIDGKGRRDHQMNMDMRLSRSLGGSYHGEQVCFDCHNSHGVGVKHIKDDAASCTTCHAFDAKEGFDGTRGWEKFGFGNWGTEGGRAASRQHLFNLNDEGNVYGLSPEQYTWVLKDGGDAKTEADWQAIWPWRLAELEAQGKTVYTGAEPWNQ